jgi:two-component system response regulator
MVDVDYKPILLVEDDSLDEQRILQAFQRNEMGHIIQVVRDGADALTFLFGGTEGSTLRSPPPRLILLDLRLPRVHGIEILRRIRENPQGKAIPVIVFTASDEEQDEVEATRLGVDAYVRKPTDAREFPKAMEKIGLAWLIHNQ